MVSLGPSLMAPPRPGWLQEGGWRPPAACRCRDPWHRAARQDRPWHRTRRAADCRCASCGRCRRCGAPSHRCAGRRAGRRGRPARPRTVTDRRGRNSRCGQQRQAGRAVSRGAHVGEFGGDGIGQLQLRRATAETRRVCGRNEAPCHRFVEAARGEHAARETAAVLDGGQHARGDVAETRQRIDRHVVDANHAHGLFGEIGLLRDVRAP